MSRLEEVKGDVYFYRSFRTIKQIVKLLESIAISLAILCDKEEKI